MPVIVALPVESCSKEVVNGARPIDRDGTGAKGGLESVFFVGVLREEDKVINVNADVYWFFLRSRWMVDRRIWL